MANYTQNITNAVRCFGPAASTKWGQANFAYTMTWGVSKWGEDGINPTQFIKVISESQSMTWDRSSVGVGKNFEIGSIAADNDMGSEELTQGSWNYVFVSNEQDAEDRDLATWTEGQSPDATFTCQAANGTSWSEV